ncbi:MAG: hypothetical protein IPP83_04050 [Flavobacteriales bacterium]|nr:hypothetical protein [Flavobacteriales bacterium]
MIIFILHTASLPAQELRLSHCSCTSGGIPSDSTFTFRGRLSAWNGAPTWRIWRVGTHRILGIRSTCADSLDLGELTPYFEKELWADFTVSAVTRQRPGVMQFVCIRSIAHPFLRERQR